MNKTIQISFLEHNAILGYSYTKLLIRVLRGGVLYNSIAFRFMVVV